MWFGRVPERRIMAYEVFGVGEHHPAARPRAMTRRRVGALCALDHRLPAPPQAGFQRQVWPSGGRGLALQMPECAGPFVDDNGRRTGVRVTRRAARGRTPKNPLDFIGTASVAVVIQGPARPVEAHSLADRGASGRASITIGAMLTPGAQRMTTRARKSADPVRSSGNECCTSREGDTDQERSSFNSPKPTLQRPQVQASRIAAWICSPAAKARP